MNTYTFFTIGNDLNKYNSKNSNEILYKCLKNPSGSRLKEIAAQKNGAKERYDPKLDIAPENSVPRTPSKAIRVYVNHTKNGNPVK